MHRFDGLRCPWCHDGVSADEALVVCRDCLAAHHEGCWSEASRCATCARTRALVPREARADRRLAPWWVRWLARIAGAYVVSGPLALLVGGLLDLLGASRREYESWYFWFLFSCFVLFMGLLGAGVLWVIERLGALALKRRGLHPAVQRERGAGKEARALVEPRRATERVQSVNG